MNFTINIKKGVGDLVFGMPVETVVATLGHADSVENIENADDEQTTVLHYDELDMTLFFEEENPVLTCIDLGNEESTLFGKKVFELDERALVQLMVGEGYTEQDVDDEAWGERRVSFPEADVDFFFDDGELMSVNLGQ